MMFVVALAAMKILRDPAEVITPLAVKRP